MKGVSIDWSEVEDLVRESYRRVAPKAMLAKLDESRPRPKRPRKPIKKAKK
jgi:hypothetical protein